ncbi:hypothetical protein A0X14_01775 [Campylobacter coli]|nr:hypothetical protein [Campylobacter coli]
MKLSEFDFRIWDGKKYINNIKGGVYIHKINDHIKCLNRNQDCYDYEFELDDLDNSNLEIELFTGFYDKNGKKIYEGDIFCCRNYLYIITFIEGEFRVYDTRNCFISTWVDFNHELFYSIEVVGNIHENSELLK